MDVQTYPNNRNTLNPIAAVTDTPEVQEARAKSGRAFQDAQRGIIGAQVNIYILGLCRILSGWISD